MSVNPEVKTLEELILAGIIRRFQQVFGCRCVFTTAADKTAVLAKLFEGAPVEYPYAFLNLTSIAPNPESYNPHSLGRRGILTSIQSDFAHTVRLLPANFEIEIEYHTDQYQGFTGRSVQAFNRRWLFARRMGYLKFNCSYGRLMLLVSSTLNDSISVPPKENTTDSESVYKVPASLVVHGYVSEPTLGTQGIITALEVDTVVKGMEAEGVETQFFSF